MEINRSRLRPLALKRRPLRRWCAIYSMRARVPARALVRRQPPEISVRRLARVTAGDAADRRPRLARPPSSIRARRESVGVDVARLLASRTARARRPSSSSRRVRRRGGWINLRRRPGRRQARARHGGAQQRGDGESAHEI